MEPREASRACAAAEHNGVHTPQDTWMILPSRWAGVAVLPSGAPGASPNTSRRTRAPMSLTLGALKSRDLLGLDVTGMSFLYTAAGFGAFVGAMTLLFLKNPEQKGRLAFAAGGGFAIALALFSLSRLLWLSVALLFVMGFLLMTFSTTVSTLLQTHAPTELRGRVMSVYTISWQGLEYVGVLLTGGLAALVSTSLVVLGAAVIVGALIVTVQAYHRGALQLQ
jgi:predicted MFS family arabinose efflux permease